MNKNNHLKVFVAMSGGVDSSIAAALLQKKGFEVIGVYMKNWSGENYGIASNCPWQKDIDFASSVCSKLNIPFKIYNFEKEYREKVIEYFFNEYKNGATPNPDILCNKEIKFDLFLEKAIQEGANYIATGHYAKIIKSKKVSYKTSCTSRYHLFMAKDKNKDQSYFLCRLNQYQLSKSIFPLGNIEKLKVRKMAKEIGLSNAERKDSQGICFIGKINVREFLMRNILKTPGKIIDMDSNQIVGQHAGLSFYTIGQREGIGIGSNTLPYYVVKKELVRNILFIAKGNENPLLYKKYIKLEDVNWILNLKPDFPLHCKVSIRYRQKPINAILKKLDNNIIVETIMPLRAVSAGQICVFYINHEIIGAGRIS